MTKFITLRMLLDQGGSKSKGARMVEAPTFLNWKIGYRIKPKNSHGDTDIFTIVGVDGGDMSYQASVTLKNPMDETRTLKGSTIQSGYSFVDHGDVRAPTSDADDGFSKALTVQVDQIRDFYPRKNDMPGTRVILVSGTAYAVTNSHDEIAKAVEAQTIS